MKKNHKIRIIAGKVLKAQRIRLGISQEDLAGMCEVDRSYISQIERGLNEPSISKLFDLCDGLKITPSSFMQMIELEYKKEINE